MEIDKIKAFDYMLHLFFQWRNSHKELGDTKLGFMMAQRLLFLASAPKEDGGEDLLDIFDNFYAMPDGPVEADIYNVLEEDRLPLFTNKNRKFELREGVEPYDPKRYNGELYNRVRHAVDDLRKKNEKLILLNPFEVCAITQSWYAWNIAMDFAEFMGQMSAKMSIDSIRDSSKIFDLK